ncbi:MAG: ABC transporter ATP-binding protein [Gammaproteobacteria bacterium]|nr:ABC transporter ATP-binding protein [Gammaproteobacteria bacterium]
MTSALELKNISVAYDNHKVIDAISFELNEGDIGCLLGPSGCGKTTLLRTIAGFEAPQDGEVWIRGIRVSDRKRLVPVELRHAGMVFQDSALFPHMTVRENIAFGLQQIHGGRKEARITELVDLLAVGEFLDKYPHQLSGGQQQRVALARAIASRPRILLLDEPFASLDFELREQLAREVRNVLKQDGITAVMVSHNQLEAFAMADIVGVINEGRLLQWDTAFNLYHRPATAYVADFVGEGVFLSGKVIGDKEVQTELGTITGTISLGLNHGAAVEVLIRPDDIVHDDNSAMTAKVLDKAFRGAEFLYTLMLASGTRVLSLVPSHHNHPINEPIGIRLEIDHLVVFPERG